MSQDDFHVIVYRILKYLYGCLKSGAKPDNDDLAADGPLMHITESYRVVVFNELLKKGLIEGVAIDRFFGGEKAVTLIDPTITMDGVEYLQENSMMAKVAQFLRGAKETIPGL